MLIYIIVQPDFISSIIRGVIKSYTFIKLKRSVFTVYFFLSRKNSYLVKIK